MREISAVVVGAIGIVTLTQNAFAQYAPSVPASPGPGKPFLPTAWLPACCWP